MSLEKTNEPYEVLIRYSKDEQGNTVVAGQMQRIQKIVLDGELLKEEILSPEFLDLSSLPSSDFMTQLQQDAVNQATRLEAENRGLLLRLTQLESTLRAAWAADVAAHKDTIKSFANDAVIKSQHIATMVETITSLREALAIATGAKVATTTGEDTPA